MLLHREADFIYSNTLAARLGLSNNTLSRMVRHDQFPRPVKAPSGVIAWHRADVEAWLLGLAACPPQFRLNDGPRQTTRIC